MAALALRSGLRMKNTKRKSFIHNRCMGLGHLGKNSNETNDSSVGDRSLLSSTMTSAMCIADSKLIIKASGCIEIAKQNVGADHLACHSTIHALEWKHTDARGVHFQ